MPDTVKGISDLLGRPRHVLLVRLATRFVVGESGRLLHENSPDCSPAPRMWMGGSAAGNIVRVRADVHDDVANEIESLAAYERPLAARDSVPGHKEEYARLLGAGSGALASGATYLLPNRLAYDHDAAVISNDTEEGRDLLARMQAEGMPATLADLGFDDTTHLWPPWCVALVDGVIASIAFTARLSRDGAEVGVATIPTFRGRGLAAATTAAWASLPELSTRILFYSTESTNVPSRRVAERLGLELLGAEFVIV